MGLDNVQVDWLSHCRLREAEWHLNPLVFKEIQRRFGVPEVDLFTSATNAQLPRFFSCGQQEGTEVVDALQSAWPQGLLYALLPVALFATSPDKDL